MQSEPVVLVPIVKLESLKIRALHEASTALCRSSTDERAYWQGFLKAITLIQSSDQKIDELFERA